MSTHNKISEWPAALLRRWLLSAAAGIGLLLAGLAASLAMRDTILLALSLLLTLFFAVRCISFYFIIIRDAYETLEGVCVELKRLPLKKQQRVRLMTPDGLEHKLLLDKQTRLSIGNCYRIYIKSRPRAETAYLPQMFQPQDLFLGMDDLGPFEDGHAEARMGASAASDTDAQRKSDETSAGG